MTVYTATHAPRAGAASLFSVAAEMVGDLRRWNLRRKAAAELRALNRSQLNDIGLDGVDLDDYARRLVR